MNFLLGRKDSDNEQLNVAPSVNTVSMADFTMEKEKSASLTETTKKMFDDLLDSYQQREAAIKMYVDQAEKQVTEARVTLKLILEKAERDGKAMITAAEEKCERMNEDQKDWEKEKEKISRTNHFENNEIKLDIGGQSFTTTQSTLTRFPDTMIGAMFSGHHALKKNDAGAFFIDRDGMHFRLILNFLRSPEKFEFDLDANVLKELRTEAEFYGLEGRMFPFTTVVSKEEYLEAALAMPIQTGISRRHSTSDCTSEQSTLTSNSINKQDTLIKPEPVETIKNVEGDAVQAAVPERISEKKLEQNRTVTALKCSVENLTIHNQNLLAKGISPTARKSPSQKSLTDKPTTVKSVEGFAMTVTKDSLGIWSMHNVQYNMPSTIVTFCHHCKLGWIKAPINYPNYHVNMTIKSFNAGRQILTTQPICNVEKPCPSCHHKDPSVF
jgi:hypothetical protein